MLCITDRPLWKQEHVMLLFFFHFEILALLENLPRPEANIEGMKLRRVFGINFSNASKRGVL